MGVFCKHLDCPTQARYGVKGTRRPIFCREHKRAGMVCVRSKQCGYQGCSKQPSFGPEGSRQRELCSEHKRAGMVYVITKGCGYQGCSKQPSFGTEGSRKREFCSEHKRMGMVCVVNKPCAYQGCSKRPFFGSKDTRKVEFCSEHKRVGMVCVVNKPCAYQGCYRQPSFGSEGSRKVEFCSEHKRAGMVDISHKRFPTEGCVKNAVYRLDDSKFKRLLCPRHVTEDYQAGASALEEAKSGEEAKEMGEEAGGQVALPKTRKRAVRDQRFSQQAQKTSGSLDGGPSQGKRMRVLETGKGNPSREAQQEQAKILQDKVEQLKNQVADAVAGKAHAVAEARGKVEEKYTEIIQALRNEHVAASRALKDSKGALEAVFEERKALQQQVTKLQAQVACAAGRVKEEAAKVGKAKEDFQHSMEALRAELTVASTGWENAKDDLKEVRQERDALHKELDTQMTFAVDIASKVAANSKALGDRMKIVKGGPGTTMKAQTRRMVGTIAPGPVISASLLQSVKTGLATIASPAAIVASTGPGKSSEWAPASELPTPAAAAAPPIIGVDGVVEKGEMDDNMGLRELQNEEAGEETVSTLGCIDMSTVAIKPER